MQLLVRLLLLVLVSQPCAAQQQPSSETISFQEMTFQLSGAGWNRNETSDQITLVRSEKQSYSQSLALWAVRFDESLRAISQRAHASAYFRLERKKERPKELRWGGFLEAVRTIGGMQYPIMSFDVLSTDGTTSEGLFLLYFPSDFRERQSFYCFMYMELYPAGEVSHRLYLPVLDGAVSSFQVKALSPVTERSSPAFTGKGAFAKMMAGDLEGALAEYTREIERDPQNAELYVMRANVRDRKRDLDGAIADYAHALTIDPRHALAYQLRGSARAKNGDADGAISDFTSALAINPTMYGVLTLRGRVRSQKGDLDGAIADLTAELERYPGNALARVTRGFVKRSKGDLRGAIEDFTGSIKQLPDGAESYWYRAHAEYDMGAWKNALADFRKFSELAEAPAQGYARLRIWLIRARFGEAQPASQELTNYLTSWRSGDVDPWLAMLGRFLTGGISEPELFEAASSRDEKVARERQCEAYFYAGTKRLVSGDATTARTYFERAVDTGVTSFTEYASARAELDAMLKQKR
jgi:lipoprotein NlpI